MEVSVSDYNINDFSYNFFLIIVLQEPPTLSQFTMLSDNIIQYHWMSTAIHMGITYQHCERISGRYENLEKDIPYHCSLRAFIDWLNREEGTGDLPRTRDTMFKAIKKLVNSRERGYNVDFVKRDIAKALHMLMEDWGK